MQCFQSLPVIIWSEHSVCSMSNTPQQDSNLSLSSSVNGNGVDFTFHLFLWAAHLLHVSEQAHANGYRVFLPVPSVTQWFLPYQLLGNLSTGTSGV
jgi:hypothetical protein